MFSGGLLSCFFPYVVGIILCFWLFLSWKDQKSLELNSQKRIISSTWTSPVREFPAPYFSVVGAKLLTSEVKARGAKTLGCCKSPNIWDLLEPFSKLRLVKHKSNALSLENHLASTILKGSGLSVPWMVFFLFPGCVFLEKHPTPSWITDIQHDPTHSAEVEEKLRNLHSERWVANQTNTSVRSAEVCRLGIIKCGTFW